ncbi:FtsX-like permease family protein [Clostridium sp. C8-1-8]|uniref:FtsX-like permease family protein n=1 Tax=Clostridium sp. C8-1-8 TaxID=2698831 RepID=UPI00136D6550|nr:FtsX-like permease family protein [Clostridium sp. C8-1-8]
MNIFNKVTLQSMKKSRTRTIVTVIGVVLSAAMITAVATFGVSLLNYMINGAIVKYGDWHVEFMNVPSSFVQQKSQDKAVSNTITFENIGYASLNGAQNPNKPYVFVAGFTKEAFDKLPITLISGRLPKNNDEILVPEHVKTNGGVKLTIGDKLSLAVGSRMEVNQELNQHAPYLSGKENLIPKTKKTYTVVGICQRPTFEEASAPGYTLITKADPQDKINSFSLFVKLKNPRSIHSYTKTSAGNESFVFNDNVLRYMGLSDDNLFNTILYSIGGIVLSIIIIGSIFLIYNAFTISLNERTRQFGILSSVGATARQLQNSVMFEGLCIGAIGIPIGVILGIVSIGLVISVVSKNFANIAYSNVALTLTVSIPAIIVAVVVSMVTILISAYIPARKAASAPVLESIRQTNEVKVEAKAVETSKLAQRIYGLEGTLALKNFKRNKKRYRSIVLSLTLSIVLFVSTSAFGTDLKDVAKKSVMTNDYDICFSTQDMSESEMFRLYDKFKTVDGIYQSSYQAIMTYSCVAKKSDFSDLYKKYYGNDLNDETVNLPMDIQFIKDSEYMSFIKSLGLPIKEYTGQNPKMIAVAKAKKVNTKKDGNSDLINMFSNRSMNFNIAPEINDKLKMEQSQNIDFTLVDTIPIDMLPRNLTKPKTFTFMVIAPYELKDRFETPGTHVDIKGLTFRSKTPSISVAKMEKIIQSSGITSDYNLYNVSKILEQNRSTTFVVDVFTYVFVIMISLIAVANVFNTISTNIKLRRRELSMLRSVGMSEQDFQKMMNFECAFYGMRALLFGLPLSALSSWLIYRWMDGGSNTVKFVFPWLSMGISVFSVFFVVFITMLYAISKIKKENIIDALRDDMT